MMKNQIVFDRVNHFHVLVYIKKDVVYKYSLETLNRIAPDKIWFEEHKWETVSIDLSACAAPDNVGIGKNNTNENNNVGIGMKNIDKNVNAVKSKDVDRLKLKTPVPYRHFGHLFNAYSRYQQICTGRTGNLFKRPFKRKQIDNEEYLKSVILYIHNNPVHHGFCDHPLEYPWSSFITCVSDKPTKLKRRAVVKLFENNQQFETEHLKPVDTEQMDKWLDIDVDYTTDINNRTTPDLSAYAEFRQIGTGPDNVNRGVGGTVVKFNAVKSEDVDRLEERDLSAFAATDNVSGDGNGTVVKFNAVKSEDVDRLEERDLSAFAAFRQAKQQVPEIQVNRKRETNEKNMNGK